MAGSEVVVAAGNHNFWKPALSLGWDVVGVLELVLHHLTGKRQLFH